MREARDGAQNEYAYILFSSTPSATNPKKNGVFVWGGINQVYKTHRALLSALE